MRFKRGVLSVDIRVFPMEPWNLWKRENRSLYDRNLEKWERGASVMLEVYQTSEAALM